MSRDREEAENVEHFGEQSVMQSSLYPTLSYWLSVWTWMSLKRVSDMEPRN